MKDLNIYQFENYIKPMVEEFSNTIQAKPIPTKITKSLLLIMLRCPGSKVSKLGITFAEMGIITKQDFIIQLSEIKKITRVKTIDQYIWSDVFLQDEWFEVFKQMYSNRKPFIYLHKSGPHLETLFTSLRNSIAHGRFVIKDGFITLWNISRNNNIKALLHMRISSFIAISNKLKL